MQMSWRADSDHCGCGGPAARGRHCPRRGPYRGFQVGPDARAADAEMDVNGQNWPTFLALDWPLGLSHLGVYRERIAVSRNVSGDSDSTRLRGPPR
jgi:hypothetical protein